MGSNLKNALSHRFRGFLPVVIDVETGGFNSQTDALLEIAAISLHFDENGWLKKYRTSHFHVSPFAGANIEKASLEFTGIDPWHPFRNAVDEKVALTEIFGEVRKALSNLECKRAILVGHNAFFDHQFLFAATQRAAIKRNPFHPFSCFDTATLGGVALGQTVLARACIAAGISFNQKEAHSALYDADKTADLFCHIVNRWRALGGLDEVLPVSGGDDDLMDLR
ncbi:Ribonuclease T [gamma proteobacterium HdN1]|nr:Ribonuclease T [gamma proteobacterium HdN1]